MESEELREFLIGSWRIVETDRPSVPGSEYDLSTVVCHYQRDGWLIHEFPNASIGKRMTFKYTPIPPRVLIVPNKGESRWFITVEVIDKDNFLVVSADGKRSRCAELREGR